MATHSSVFAWRLPWTEEPGRLQSVGLPRVRHDWATNTFTFTFLLKVMSPQAGGLKKNDQVNFALNWVGRVLRSCTILEGVTLSWVQGVYQRCSLVCPGPWGAGGMFASSVWLGQEEHESLRELEGRVWRQRGCFIQADAASVWSFFFFFLEHGKRGFQKVKWLEQSDSAAFAKFYIKAQWGGHQTSLELEFPFSQLEKCFSQFWVQLGWQWKLLFLFTLLSLNITLVDSGFVRGYSMDSTC